MKSITKLRENNTKVNPLESLSKGIEDRNQENPKTKKQQKQPSNATKTIWMLEFSIYAIL